jgi:hypothetical protein
MMNTKLILKKFASSMRQASDIVEAPIVSPASGEVLIRNRYVGINPLYDCQVCRNKIPHRSSKLGQTLGVEAVGDVVEIGAGVTELREGDCVSTVTVGSAYQTYQTVPVEHVIRIPAASAEYLTLCPTGVSALVSLQQVGKLGSNETCIVSAAAGGLGHMVVELMKAADNHVIAVCVSSHKAELCSHLGADRVIDYSHEDLDTVLSNEYPSGIDLAYDSVGQNIFDSFVDHLAVRGRLVSIGHAADLAAESPAMVLQPRIYTKLYWKAASIHGFMNSLFIDYHQQARWELNDLYQTERLKVVVDRRYDGIESIVPASEYLLEGSNLGKVVVSL